MTREKRYDRGGMRTTNCCGRYSTICQDSHILYCKKCGEEVEWGEGDGSEFHPDASKEEYWKNIESAVKSAAVRGIFGKEIH